VSASAARTQVQRAALGVDEHRAEPVVGDRDPLDPPYGAEPPIVVVELLLSIFPAVATATTATAALLPARREWRGRARGLWAGR
jgi:hypothetical protein